MSARELHQPSLPLGSPTIRAPADPAIGVAPARQVPGLLLLVKLHHVSVIQQILVVLTDG